MSSDSNLYSEDQMRILQLIPYFSGTMSVLGSVAVIHVLRVDPKEQKPSPFRRLMFALSINDIIFSAGHVIFGSWAVPKGSPYALHPRGNITTCNISGFFHHLVTGAVLYSTFLAVYFLFTVRYGWSGKTFRTRLEVPMHVLGVSYPVATGAYAVHAGLMNPIDVYPGRCGLQDNPPSCSKREDIECIRGEMHFWFTTVTVGYVILLCLFIIILCMVFLVLTV